jgi:hypothetical protein
MKTTAFANNLLQLIYQNTALANIGNASGLAGSSGAGSPGSLYVSLHTSDPTTSGNQSSNEANYTGYARVAVARSGAGWTIAGNQAANAAIIQFNACTGGSNTINFFGIGTALSGAGNLLWSGPLISTYFDFTSESSNILVCPGHTLTVNQAVQVISMPNGTIPTGLSTGTTYYVLTVSGDSITLSLTPGGSVVAISTTGAGAVGAISPLAVSSGVTPQFGAGALIGTIEF